MSEKVQGNIGLLVGKVANVDKQGYAEIRFLTKSRKDRAINCWTKTVLKSRAARFRKQKREISDYRRKARIRNKKNFGRGIYLFGKENPGES